MKDSVKNLLKGCAMLIAIFAGMAIIILTVSLLDVHFTVRRHREFLRYMDHVVVGEPKTVPDRIVFTAQGGRKSAIIEDSRAIGRVMDRFRAGTLAGVVEHQNNRPRGFTVDLNVRFEFASKSVAGTVYSGGKAGLGFGFLVEREEDAHWFYGAWDPWPTKAYWFNVFPYEWIEHPPDEEEDRWLYEIFSFFFWLPDTDLELRMTSDGMSFKLLNPDKRKDSEFARDLVRLGSIREFFELHPDRRLGFLGDEKHPEQNGED